MHDFSGPSSPPFKLRRQMGGRYRQTAWPTFVNQSEGVPWNDGSLRNLFDVQMIVKTSSLASTMFRWYSCGKDRSFHRGPRVSIDIYSRGYVTNSREAARHGRVLISELRQLCRGHCFPPVPVRPPSSDDKLKNISDQRYRYECRNSCRQSYGKLWSHPERHIAA